MCSKKRYPDSDTATYVMHKMWARKVGFGKLPCRVYRCPTCKAWHVTSRAAR